MYRVVFMDKDSALTARLCDEIDWAQYDCEVVGSANSAQAGAELIRSEHPHIVFMEALMPDGDALAMLAELRGEFPAMRVTVLTNCRDFSCIQRVVPLGVTRFLLKPPSAEEMQEALKAMITQIEGSRDTGGCFDSETAALGSFVVRQAVNYMEREYAQKLTLQDVADHCFVSSWYLSRLIHRYIQKNFYDVLNSIRIEQAKQLLTDPSLKIGEIVEMVGFSDSTHFAHTFKKFVGVSAHQYRNQRRLQALAPSRWAAAQTCQGTLPLDPAAFEKAGETFTGPQIAFEGTR